ncbi:MAG: RNA polymerase sigma factor [Flavipsychrobacter sp.]
MTATDFNEVISTHSDFLKPYAISLTNNQEDAKDLFQETMMRALINREKYQLGTNLKAWLYTIMRNIFINNYRRSKKFVKADDTEILNYGNKAATYNNGISNLRVSEIKNAMEQLPQALRTSFELHFTGYKYQEIADMLEEPLGTVKSRIHFARKMMAAKVEP